MVRINQPSLPPQAEPAERLPPRKALPGLRGAAYLVRGVLGIAVANRESAVSVHVGNRQKSQRSARGQVNWAVTARRGATVPVTLQNWVLISWLTSTFRR